MNLFLPVATAATLVTAPITAKTAKPEMVADALIRSMLGSQQSFAMAPSTKASQGTDARVSNTAQRPPSRGGSAQGAAVAPDDDTAVASAKAKSLDAPIEVTETPAPSTPVVEDIQEPSAPVMEEQSSAGVDASAPLVSTVNAEAPGVLNSAGPVPIANAARVDDAPAAGVPARGKVNPAQGAPILSAPLTQTLSAGAASNVAGDAQRSTIATTVTTTVATSGASLPSRSDAPGTPIVENQPSLGQEPLVSANLPLSGLSTASAPASQVSNTPAGESSTLADFDIPAANGPRDRAVSIPMDAPVMKGSQASGTAPSPKVERRARAAAVQSTEASNATPVPFSAPISVQVVPLAAEERESSDSVADQQNSNTGVEAAGAASWTSNETATPAPLAFSADLTAIPQSTGEVMQGEPISSPVLAATGPNPKSEPAAAGENPEPRAAAAPGGDDFSRFDSAIAQPAASPTREAPADAKTVGECDTAASKCVETAAGVQIPGDTTKPAGSAVQEIAVRISRPEEPAVDLHVMERGGEIHVAVRTPDVELQTSLRQDLGTLAGSLERAGFHAETYVPRAAAGAQMNLREERQAGQQGFSNRGGSQDSPKQQKRGRPGSWVTGGSWLEELEQSR